jgi:processive 1,2-diacylglycerol beta-glucosyltransferase
MAMRLYEVGTNRLCGTLSDRQFDLLAEALEEEDLEDGSWTITRDTVDALEDQGADPDLLDILRLALADRDEADIRCERG